MTETSGFLDRPDGHRLAWRKVEGAGPTVVWLGGFRSDMAGTKAQALADWAQARGRAYVRFDYFGHGESDGAFVDGTITRWREDALAVLESLVEGPAVLVGSSMGGGIACLALSARIWARGDRAEWMAAAAVAGGMGVGFILSRTLGLPGFHEGEWELSGLISLLLEGTVVVAAARIATDGAPALAQAR